ncbi:PAPS1 [Symbiodinium sp. CCMP2592]|nr:PAPS1 [Symbiodinium sp. CCMP2592]
MQKQLMFKLLKEVKALRKELKDVKQTLAAAFEAIDVNKDDTVSKEARRKAVAKKNQEACARKLEQAKEKEDAEKARAEEAAKRRAEEDKKEQEADAKKLEEVADRFSSASVSKAATVEEMRQTARDALLQGAKSGKLLEVLRERTSKVFSPKPWNPKTRLADKQHLMPVITPACPAMKSKHSVTDTTKRILFDEFRRGYEVVNKVENNKADWKEVHNPFHFFSNDRFK